MSVTLTRIFFFCLIPIGIFILVKGIKILKKTFNGKIIIEIPYSQQSGEFTISKEGYYSIWQKGQAFKRTPVDQFSTHIFNKTTNSEVHLNYAILGSNTNDGSTGRMELYKFYATPGIYSIELAEGSSTTKLQRIVGQIIPLKMGDLSKYYIQVRESSSQIMAVLGILITILGSFSIIGGFVLGLLADQLF